MKSVYLIGSLRNREMVQNTADFLRGCEFDVFDDWLAPGPTADDQWKEYEQARGHSYAEALKGYAAQHIFEFDKHHLDRCEMAVLVMPAGKSGFLELGYMIGWGKPAWIVYPDGPPDDRYDVMFRFANGVAFSLDKLEEMIMKEQTRTLVRLGDTYEEYVL